MWYLKFKQTKKIFILRAFNLCIKFKLYMMVQNETIMCFMGYAVPLTLYKQIST